MATGTYTWRVTNGSFGVAANWKNNTTGDNPALSPPGINDTANFNATGGTVTGTGSVDRLQINAGASAAWTFNGDFTAATTNVLSATYLAGGSILHLRNRSIPQRLPFSGNINAPTTLQGSTLDSVLGTLNIGYSLYAIPTAGAVLTVQGGGIASALAAAVGVGAAGTLTVTGAGSQFRSVRNTFVDTPDLTSGYLTLGAAATVNNATTPGNGTLKVVSGGALSVDHNLNIGYDQGSSGTATVSTGGVIDVKDGFANVATLAGSRGTLMVNAGGTFKLSFAPQTAVYAINIGGYSSALGAVGAASVVGAGALLDSNNNGGSVGLGKSSTGTLTPSGRRRREVRDDGLECDRLAQHRA